MRETVDKFFPDGFMVAGYMGLTTDVSIQWQAYPAAKAALENTLRPATIKSSAEKYCAIAVDACVRLRGYLGEVGWSQMQLALFITTTLPSPRNFTGHAHGRVCARTYS